MVGFVHIKNGVGKVGHIADCCEFLVEQMLANCCRQAVQKMSFEKMALGLIFRQNKIILSSKAEGLSEPKGGW